MLEILIVMVVVGVISYFIAAGRSSVTKSSEPSATRATTRSTSSRSGSESRGGPTGKQRILEANQQWLTERWRMADSEEAAGNLRHFALSGRFKA
jgi:hypothetical protein